MHKLTLKLDELRVESFTTAHQSHSRGTVRAHSATVNPNESVSCPEDWTMDCTWNCDTVGGESADACYSGGMNNCTTRIEN
jgi:hypothetical protein